MGFMMSAECAKIAALLDAIVKEEQLFIVCFVVSKGIKSNCSLKLW